MTTKVPLQLKPAPDYLISDNITDVIAISRSNHELSNIINKTSSSMAYQDAIHFLNVLHVCIDGGKLISVCTDGHRLAKYTSSISYDSDLSVIIPRKCVMEIKRIIGANDDNKEIITELYVNNNSITLIIDDYVLI